MAEGARPLPAPTPETKHFWEGTKAGELRLQRCDDCRHTYFPPRPFCPKCASRKVSVVKAAGKGKLFSYVIHHRPAPGFTPPTSAGSSPGSCGRSASNRARRVVARDCTISAIRRTAGLCALPDCFACIACCWAMLLSA